MIAAVSAVPSSAEVRKFSFSGIAGDAGAFSGTLDLDITGGLVTSGKGTVSVLDFLNSPIAMITTATPYNIATAGPQYPVGFRANDGTDLYGADQNFPLDIGGLLFAIGTDTPSFGANPLINLYSDNGNLGSVFTGRDGSGVEHYVQFGSLQLAEITAAVPEPATWAVMMLGFGVVAGAMRYRRNSVSVSFA